MLGMNRFTEKDTQHPFDMSHTKGYNILWMPQITRAEKKCSTPIYEMTKTIDLFLNDYNSNNPDFDQITKDDILFIVGRGTIGKDSEENLLEAILEARRTYSRNAFFIFYAKSFGVVDTLRTFKLLQKECSQFTADLMISIDGYATPISLASVSQKYKVNGHEEYRFIIPTNVKKIFNIVQRKEGFKGLNVGGLNDQPRCCNYTLTKSDVSQKYYTNYSDGYKRKLNLCHFNMEEIVSTVPCCSFSNRMFTVNEIVRMYCFKYAQGSYNF